MRVSLHGAGKGPERQKRIYETFPIFLDPYWSVCCNCLARMATTPQPKAIGAPPLKPDNSGARDGLSESAVVHSPAQLVEVAESKETDLALLRIPVEVGVAVPVRKFRVRNLLALDRGQVIETQWLDGDDLPLEAPGVQLAWTEFEVIDRTLAVRITRLA